MKKRVSILIYSLAGGGAERVVSILSDALSEEYDVTLVLMNNTIAFDIPRHIQIFFLENSDPHEHGMKKLLKLPLLGLRYKRFCQKNSIDISLAFTNRPSYISIFAKIFGNHIPTIISERTTPSMMYKENNLLSRVNKLLIRYLYPRADTIITNSEGNRLDLIKHFFIDPQCIETIYNPFDLTKIKQSAIKEVPEHSFDIFTFISVGRLDRGKNHRLLIEAFSMLEDTATQLIILGEGVEREGLQRYIRSLSLQERVFLLGFDRNPYQYLIRSDLFVFTSRYEGFPNVLVESLACGLPVISTDCKSGPREILAPETRIDKQLRHGIEKG